MRSPPLWPWKYTLKALVGRSLPPDAPADWSVLADYSHTYPSGHVAGSAALLGTIAVISSAGRALSAKATLAVLVVTTVLSVAGMALYVHAHLFSDVIGGMLLGGAVVTPGTAFVYPGEGGPSRPDDPAPHHGRQTRTRPPRARSDSGS